MTANILYFVFFAGLFALMMRFGCGAHVMGHRGKQDDSSLNEPHDRVANISANPRAQGTDPVCGMSVHQTQAKSAVYKGHAYYFCSPSRRDKFEINPVGYIPPGTTAAT